MLAVPEGSGGEGGSVLYFRVPDVQVAAEASPPVASRWKVNRTWCTATSM